MAEKSRNKPVVLKGLRWQQFRKRFGVRRRGPITALDVDGSVLRAVNASPRGTRSVITRIVAERLEFPAAADRSDPLELGRAIGRTLDKLRLSPGSVVMAIPRASVVLRTLTLPEVSDVRELASVVHLQVARDLPFYAEEAVIDFRIRRQIADPPPVTEPSQEGGGGEEALTAVPAVPRRKIEVLVAAVQQEVVEFYRQTATAAGLKLAALGLLSYGNARCLEACRAAAGHECVAFITLRPDEVGIDVISQQTLLFSRGASIKPRPQPVAEPAPVVLGAAIPPAADPAAATAVPAPVKGEPPPTAPETFANMVTIEVVRTLASYGGIEPANPVAKIIIAGATGQETGVTEALSRRLGLPCVFLDPATALDLPRAARENAPGAVGALGLALGINDPQGLPFDFLNPKRPAVHRDMKRVRLLMGAAAVGAAVVFILALGRTLEHRRRVILNEVQALVTKEKRQQPLYKRTQLQFSTVRDWTAESHRWLDHYAYLSAILPASEDLYVQSISISGQGTIRLAVQARGGDVLARVEKKLHAAGYDVKPLAITPSPDKTGYNFRSEVAIAPTEKLKIDLVKNHPLPRPADDISLQPVPKTLRKGGGS